MNGRELEQKRTSWPAVYMLSLLIVIQEIPYIQRRFSMGIFIPLIALLALVTYDGKIAIKKKNLGFASCAILYFLIAIAYKLLGISSAGFGNDMHTLLYFAFFLTINSVLNMDRRQMKFTLCVVILVMLVQMLSNTLDLQRYGNAYFQVFSDSENMGKSNVSSTVYTCAIMLMAGILLLAIMNDKSRKRRRVWIVLFVICNLFNLMVMQRTIILILSVIMYALLIIFNSKNSFITNMLIVIAAVLGILTVRNFDIVLSYIGNLINSERITTRLNQIIWAMDQGDIFSSTQRFVLIGNSINTWKSSIRILLIGTGDHIASNNIIGNHSQLIDTLAQYGVVGALLFYYSIYSSLSLLIQKLPIKRGTNIYRQVIVICIVFVVRGFIGRILHSQTAVRLFVVLPIIATLLCEGDRNNDCVNV